MTSQPRAGSGPRLSLRVFYAMGLVVLAGAGTLILVLLMLGSAIFHNHLSEAGIQDALVNRHVEEGFALAALISTGVGVLATMTPTEPAAALGDLVRQLVRIADTAHPGWEWSLMMNPETFAVIDPPETTIAAPTPGYLPRKAPVFAGAEVYAMPMLDEIVACVPLQQDSNQGHVPPAYYLLLESGTITTEPPTTGEGPR